MRDLLEKYELQDYADEIEAVSRPCVVGVTTGDPVKMGGSKVGGLPHMESSAEWPTFREIPLEFVVQVNCADCGSPFLPNEGLLLFFYDNRHWGGSLKDDGFIRVIHIPQLSSLCEKPSPKVRRPRLWGLLGHSILPRVYWESGLTFGEGVSLPDLERELVKFPHDGIEESYCEVKGELVENRFIQIGGYPNPVQSDRMESSIASLTGRGPPEDWIMILEIYDDRRTDMMWGDAGKLHFFCHREDLELRDFSNCWMEMQCG